MRLQYLRTIRNIRTNKANHICLLKKPLWLTIDFKDKNLVFYRVMDDLNVFIKNMSIILADRSRTMDRLKIPLMNF